MGEGVFCPFILMEAVVARPRAESMVLAFQGLSGYDAHRPGCFGQADGNRSPSVSHRFPARRKKATWTGSEKLQPNNPTKEEV